MSEKLQNRAIAAGKRYLERRGYEVLDESWQPAGSEDAIDLVAQDEETVVFVDVTVTAHANEGFSTDHLGRGTLEILAAKWLAENDSEGRVRFDHLDMIVVSADRALLRHHINAFGEA